MKYRGNRTVSEANIIHRMRVLKRERTPDDSPVIIEVKRQAKKLKVALGLSHTKCLDAIAKNLGFQNFRHLSEIEKHGVIDSSMKKVKDSDNPEIKTNFSNKTFSDFADTVKKPWFINPVHRDYRNNPDQILPEWE
jgi:hypothetical protein